MNNHLVLTALMDNRIHNLKGGIKTLTYCIENDIDKERCEKVLLSEKNELEILEKQRQIVFDNYLLFDVK